MWDMVLAIFAEIFSIGVDDGCRVVIDAGDLFLVYRRHDDHAMLLRNLLHQLHCWSVRDLFNSVIPASFLLGTKIWGVKNLLHAQHFHALTGTVLDH